MNHTFVEPLLEQIEKESNVLDLDNLLLFGPQIYSDSDLLVLQGHTDREYNIYTQLKDEIVQFGGYSVLILIPTAICYIMEFQLGFLFFSALFPASLFYILFCFMYLRKKFFSVHEYCTMQRMIEKELIQRSCHSSF